MHYTFVYKKPPSFNLRTCVVCHKSILPYELTNGRQMTHSGKCQRIRLLESARKRSVRNYKKVTESESAASKAKRNHASLEKQGIEVPPGTVIADPETRKAVLSYQKRKEKRQQRAAKKVILEEKKEYGRLFFRGCVGTGPGIHRILDYHTYFDCAGVEYECNWFRKDDDAWCNFRIRGKRVSQYSYTLDKICLPSGSFGLSSNLFVSLKESGWKDRLPKPFYGHSLRQYVNYIIPWVEEALGEYKAKASGRYQYDEQPWMRNAELSDKVTVRLSDPPRRTYRECDGRDGRVCSGTNINGETCHVKLHLTDLPSGYDPNETLEAERGFRPVPIE